MIAVLVPLLLAPTENALEPIGRVSNTAIDEMSGIVKSRRFKDTYWVHNDSGDSARFFAVRRNGSTAPSPSQGEGITVEGASNIDWEDIAIEGDTLYLCDTGDNRNLRPSVQIYAVKEPDPQKISSVKLKAMYDIEYSDRTETEQWRFDCEAVAVHRGSIYLVTKWRSGRSAVPDTGAALYRVEKPKPGKNLAQRLDVNTALGGWVTGADIRSDGKRLVVLTQSPKQSIWVFDMTRGPKYLSHVVERVVFSGAKQCEAVCFDNPKSVLIANEQQDLFSVPLTGK